MASVANKSVGKIGYGLMGLTWQNPVDDDTAMTCMEKAYELGATYWNGGEFYGPPERNSLHVLNKYFTKYPDQADKIVINIKGGGIPPHPHMDGRPENVKRTIEECLRILDGKKKLDLFEYARVDPNVPIEVTIRELDKYVKAGKIGGIAMSECSADSIRRAAKVATIETVEVEFSLFMTEILDNGVASTCAELGIPITAYSPLGRGFLTGQLKSFDDFSPDDFRRAIPRFQPDVFDKNLKLVNEVKKVADKKGVTPGQAAIAWVLKQGTKPGMPKIIPIPGASSPGRITENLKLVTLTDAEDEELTQILKTTEVHGERYPAMLAKLNFGNSPPLEGWTGSS